MPDARPNSEAAPSPHRGLLCRCLKLPESPWPPDHYTLLGLVWGYGDSREIEHRVLERMEMLRHHQLIQPDAVTEGMNLLAQAMNCLLDPDARRAYDRTLGLPARPTPTPPPQKNDSPVGILETPAKKTPPKTSRAKRPNTPTKPVLPTTPPIVKVFSLDDAVPLPSEDRSDGDSAEFRYRRKRPSHWKMAAVLAGMFVVLAIAVAATIAKLQEDESKSEVSDSTSDGGEEQPIEHNTAPHHNEPIAHGTGETNHEAKTNPIAHNPMPIHEAPKKDTETSSIGVTPIPADPDHEKDWVQLFDGKDLSGWLAHAMPNEGITQIHKVEKDRKVIRFDGKLKNGTLIPLWRIEDGMLVGSGLPSHLFTSRGDYENFHFRVEAKINDKGNSGQYFRAALSPGFPKGYEAQINATGADRIKTGSLYLPNVEEVLVLNAPHKPDEFFVQEVTCIGDTITIAVNGKKTVDAWKDPEFRYKRGHFALAGRRPANNRHVQVGRRQATARRAGCPQNRERESRTAQKAAEPKSQSRLHGLRSCEAHGESFTPKSAAKSFPQPRRQP